MLAPLRLLKGTKPELHPCVGFRGTVGRALTLPDRELSLNTLRVLRNAERPLKMHISPTRPRHLSIWISDLARRFDGHDEHSGSRIYGCAVDNVILNPGHLSDLEQDFATLLQEASSQGRICPKDPLGFVGKPIGAADSTFMPVGVGMVKRVFRQIWED